MIPNSRHIISRQIYSKEEITNSQIILGIVIVLFTAFASIISSRLDLELFSFWPAVILFLIFIKYYELGLICFVLSFAYQAPVILAPSFGLSAVIRLDELIFISLFPVWLLRIGVRKNAISYKAPLAKPLLFYVLIAFFSLLVRYNEISSTPFLQTGTGIKGLAPLILRLFEVVGGYLMLTDQKITLKTQNNLFRSLPIIAGFAVILSFLISHGFSPKDIFGRIIYDPHLWYTRFSLYGNTGAWGVLLMIYFFILLYWVFFFKSVVGRIVLILLMIFCINAILISGTKTAMVCLIIGLTLLMIKESKNFKLSAKMIIIIFFVLTSGVWFLEQFATAEQKKEVYRQLGKAYISTGVEGFERAYQETSLGSRFDHWIRFGDAIKEEPELLVLGRGWHRRAVYETGISLHNDLLTAIHDMGIFGGFFVIWIYSLMFRQFSNKKETSIYKMESKLLHSIMQILVLLIILSSFTGENLTFYWGVDVQFPLMIMTMAVVWKYINSVRERVQNAFL